MSRTDWSNWTPVPPPHPLAYEHLRTDTCMQTLNLAEHALGDAGATQLADALRANTSLQTLYLCANSIGEAGATQLADALRTNTSVKELYLGGNSIGDAGATQLADALRANTSVKLLYLSDNSIGDAGATQLANALRTNSRSGLVWLRLDDNKSIGEAGATQLADALRTNTSVKTLGLSGCKIGEVGARQLADALRTNTSLETLPLFFAGQLYMGISDATLALVQRLLVWEARVLRRRDLAWRRRRVLCLCLHAAAARRLATVSPPQKMVTLMRPARVALLLLRLPPDTWRGVFAYL